MNTDLMRPIIDIFGNAQIKRTSVENVVSIRGGMLSQIKGIEKKKLAFLDYCFQT